MSYEVNCSDLKNAIFQFNEENHEKKFLDGIALLGIPYEIDEKGGRKRYKLCCDDGLRIMEWLEDHQIFEKF